jgi:hypothetical protein
MLAGVEEQRTQPSLSPGSFRLVIFARWLTNVVFCLTAQRGFR